MRKLSELLQDHQMFHSRFQQDNLITKRAGGTLYGQYKQALRELYKRVRGLREDWYQLEKTKNKIKQLQAQKQLLEISKQPFAEYAKIEYNRAKLNEINAKIEKVELDIKHRTMMLEEQERSKQETFRELKRFYAQADWLKTKLEEKYGPLTEETRDALDVDMWMYRLREMIAIDFIYNGRLLNVTAEFLMALPQDMKRDFLDKIHNAGPQYFIEWYENKTEEVTPQIPQSLPMPTEKDLLQCIGGTPYMIEELK